MGKVKEKKKEDDVMSSRKTAGRKAGYVRRRAGSTREKGRRALSLILAMLMVMASSLDAIPTKAAGTETVTEETVLIGENSIAQDKGVKYEVINSTQKTLRIIGLATSHNKQIDYTTNEQKEGKVKIGVEEYTVTEVADGAFANSDLTYVYFPKTITSYGNGILDNCSNLTYVQNNSSVELKLPDFDITDTNAWYNDIVEVCAESLPVTNEKGATECYANKTPNKAWVLRFNVNANDAHFSDGSKDKYKRILYKNKITNLDEEPVREGYVFKGWSTTSTTTVAYNFNNNNVADSTFSQQNLRWFYAIWKEDGSSTAPVDISKCTVTLDQTSYDYIKGTQIKPKVTVTYNGTTLTETTDYTVSYGANNAAGDKNGYVTVTGTDSGYTGSQTVYFTINKITAPNPPATTMEVENETTTVGQIKLSDGWSWSDGNIALPEGKTIQATAVYEDTANYTNTSVTVSITRKKTVTPLKGITLEPSALSLEIGESKELTVSQEPKEASLGTVTWSLSKDGVVTLTGSGNTVTIKAVAAGTTTIEATSGGFSAKCEVTVTAPAVSKLSTDITALALDSLEYGYDNPSAKGFTITNNGNAEATNIRFSWESGKYFTINGSQLTSLAANKEMGIDVVPKPGLDAGTYEDTLTISYKNGDPLVISVSFTVKTRSIIVKADDKTITYGDPIPDLTYTIQGNKIAQDDYLDIKYSVQATSDADAGTYDIEVSAENNKNYNITCQKGVLTINQKVVANEDISFPAVDGLGYGQTLGEVKLGSNEYGNFEWVDSSFKPESGTSFQSIKLVLSDKAKTNYSFENVEGYDKSSGVITQTIEVTVMRKDIPVITFPTASSIQWGETLAASILSGGSTEEGTFEWENKDEEMTQLGLQQRTVIFKWFPEKQKEYGISDTDVEAVMRRTVEVTVKKADKQEIPKVPTVKERCSDRIIVTSVSEGVQYSLDNSNWQDSGVFVNLPSYELHRVYVRYKETATHNAGPSSEPLSVYTLVADPYDIDLSKIADDNYREALYSKYVEDGDNQSTISYNKNSGEVTLLDSEQKYTLRGNAPEITVKTGSDIILNNVVVKEIRLSGTNASLVVEGSSQVVGGIYAENNLDISGSGTLTAKEIAVSEGDLTVRNITAIVGKPDAGKAALSAKNITLDNADITVETEPASSVPAIQADEEGDIILKGDTDVKSETAGDNLYSKAPVNGQGEEVVYYTVTYQYRDGRESKKQRKKNDTVFLPTEAERGYQMVWKEMNTGKTYKPGDMVTVDSDLYFTQEATPILVARIILDSIAETIEVGDGVNLAETVEPQDALNPSVTWSSNNSQVATVNQEGNVTGIAPGTAIITVTANDGSNVSANCTVTVLAGEPAEIEVERVTVSGDTKKVAPGKKVKLTATVYPDNATDKSVSWEVSNKKYASVNSSGVVTTKKAGAGKTVTVTAISDSSGEEATYKISIMKNPVKKIKLSASKKVLKKGKSLKIKAKFTPSSGISKELTWTSSNTKVAVVNNQGKVTAKGKGKVKITAKAKDGSGKKATITLKVK